MTYLVTVTQQDIEQGKRRSYTNSPIALACRRAMGDLFGGAYEDGPALHSGDADWPTEAIPAWMERFDAGEPVEPFTFEMEIVDAEGIGGREGKP